MAILDERHPSSVEMEGVSMESIKTLMPRLLKFLKSLISPSHKAIGQPPQSAELRAEEQKAPPSLDVLNLSPRVFNCLWNANVRSIETVASMSDESLLNIRGLGVKALTELKERLASYKLSDDNSQRTGHQAE